MKTSSIILSIAGAAAAGALAGILLAPRKGKDTRKEIYKFLKKRCPLIKDGKLQELADKIAKEIKEVKEKAESTITTTAKKLKES